MSIAIRYQSKGGNTKTVAEALAAVIGGKVDIAPISTPLRGPVELLIVGGGVYAFDIDSELKAFIGTLDAGAIGRAAVFTTSSLADGTGKIATLLQARGINVVASMSFKMGLRNYGGRGGSVELTDKVKEQIKKFKGQTTID